MSFRYVSVFSGIEAASVAFEPLGWEPVAFCEIDEFPSAVLRKRYPNVPNLGDITKVDWTAFKEEHGAIDLVVGGSPCQSFSVAGKREGLAGESGLMYEYVRCVQTLLPRWFIWENVPGALSSERGWAFEQLLSEMAYGGGYNCAWRVLDAQFTRIPVRDGDGAIEGWVGPVAQRRRRVFLVGHLGDASACEVLFEPESLRWDHPSSREKRKELARAAGRGAATGGDAGSLTPWDSQAKRIFTPDSCGPTLSSGTSEGMNIQPSVLQSAGFKFHQGASAGNIGYEGEQSPTLTADWHQPAALQEVAPQAIGIYRDTTPKFSGEVSPTVRVGGDGGSNLAVAFAQNQHDKVRYVGGDGSVVGALSAQPGMKQQTFVMAPAASEPTVYCRAGGGIKRRDWRQPRPDHHGTQREGRPHHLRGGAAMTTNNESVFPSLCATDGDKQFIDNQSVDGGRLIMQEPYSCNFHAMSAERGISGTLQTKVNSLNSTNPVMLEDTADSHAVTIHDGTSWVVRRLTPTERERLQGFPDGWTDIGEWVDSKGKTRKTADGARYKALGNSFAVPVVRWIGERIQRVEDRGCGDAPSSLGKETNDPPDSDEKIEQASRYWHDVGFDEGYEVGFDDGYEAGKGSDE